MKTFRFNQLLCQSLMFFSLIFFLSSCSHFSHHSCPYSESGGHEHCGKGCHDDMAGGKKMCSMGDHSVAKVLMAPTQGNKVHGEINLSRNSEAGGLIIKVNLEGLAKNKPYGLHLHEFGDCSAADGKSAGGHFNPSNQAHGAFNDPNSHLGDLGNVTSDGAGKINTELKADRINFMGPNSIIGRGVILHADPDDLKTQPTGNSGARIACGVVAFAAQH